MEDIKTEYCGGNQNFVVAVNDDHGLAVGRSSMPFDTARAEDAIASAVYDYAFKSNESNLILFHTSSRSFEKTRVETMATATTSTLQCANFDLWFLRGEDQPIPDTYGPYFWSAALSVGMPPNSTCEEPSGSDVFSVELAIVFRFCRAYTWIRRQHSSYTVSISLSHVRT